MSKYIEAEKLKAEIERRRLSNRYIDTEGYENELLEIIDSLQLEQLEHPSITEMAIVWFNNIAENAKKLSAGNVSHLAPTIAGMAIRSAEFLEKRKQEQPKLPGYHKGLLEVKSKVDELYEEASIGLNEYDSGLYNGIAETCMKLRGFIKARLGSDEQPESELEKVARYVYESWNGGTMDDVRRDMVELGRVINARKEK